MILLEIKMISGIVFNMFSFSRKCFSSISQLIEHLKRKITNKLLPPSNQFIAKIYLETSSRSQDKQKKIV